MGVLQRFHQEFICIMKEESGVLGAWEFGAGMHNTRDEYSDIDAVFLVDHVNYDRIDNILKDLLERISDHVLLFWAEDFNNESIKNYDCVLERESEVFQYDIFLINSARKEDYICKIHYADLKKENIFFDPKGEVNALIGKASHGEKWQDDVSRLMQTYWLHIYMSAKYFLRNDYFKLEGILRILMDTHTSLLLTLFDETTWGGTANKLHYLAMEKQNHLKKYYCHEDLRIVKQNLWQSMLWFEEDTREWEPCKRNGEITELSDKIKSVWLEMLNERELS